MTSALPVDFNIAIRLSIAALIGFAAGLEREWSGHASGVDARFAGVRTFFLLGLAGGLAGHFVQSGHEALGLTFALGGILLSVCGYAMAARRPGSSTDGTTEAAAMVIVALGVLAGSGSIGLAAGAGALVVLMLREKAQLQRFIKRIDEPELRGAVQFAVLAVVVLPLLPVGPYLGPLDIRPRTLWAIVLLFAGLGFAGYLARRLIGTSRGLGVAGALGGVVSSTAVTFAFTRQSRREGDLGTALARGVIAACVMLIPRVIIASAALNPAVSLALARLLLPSLLIGLALVALGWRSGRVEPSEDPSAIDDDRNPLRLASAVRMAIAFQASMIALSFVRAHWGLQGLYASGAVLGLTDVDALTVSMSRAEVTPDASIAARAIAIGILANTSLKLSIVVLAGRGRFRVRATRGLVGLAVGTAAGLLLG